MTIRYFICILSVAIFAVGGPAFAKAGQFLSVAPDIPLLEGLREASDTSTVFDKPGGRIVSASAKGRLSIYEISAFYRETLPQLGWSPVATEVPVVTEIAFVRAEERLELELKVGTNGETLLTIRIHPLP